MYHQIIIGFLEISSEHFVTTHLQINNIPDSDVDDTKETLILLFKFLLIKYLDCEDTIFIDFQIERFIPVRVQRFLDHRRRVGLFTANGGHRKGIWESWRSIEVCQFELRSDASLGPEENRTKYIPLVQPIRRDNCRILSVSSPPKTYLQGGYAHC